MKHRLSYALGLLSLAVSGFAVGPADADTVAAGPYYATPSWDQTLPASTRFIVLSNMGGAAVLDRETGLVWQKAPSANTVTWYSAFGNCTSLIQGGRAGWRLPTSAELASLIDPSQSNPSLPAGHAFVGVFSRNNINVFDLYWSATSDPQSPTTNAFAINFFNNSTGVNTANVTKSNSSAGLAQTRAWCVRGGLGVDTQ